MDKFKIFESIPAPLPMMNIDTDMIIPKQFLKIGDRTILELSLKPLLDFSECLKICVVLSPNDEYHKSIELLQNPLVSLINGGNTRMESVKAAINHFERTKLPYKNVLIHDSVTIAWQHHSIHKN